MKIQFLGIFLLVSVLAVAQDEGAIVKKERIQRDKGVFVGGGVSIASGSNLGDYSLGINFEGGYNKRLNRVFSLGGSVSYLSFKYDASVLKNKPDINGTGISQNFYYDTNAAVVDQGFFLTLSGGDVSILSAALNLKFNFVPVKDNSIVSVYGFAKPFIASTSMSALSGVAEYWAYNYSQSDWFPNPSLNASGTYKSKSSITGGIFVGPGIEINPAKPVSIFFQASFGYTFPMDIVSTRSFSNDVNDLGSDAFPISSLGFTSINFAAGISFNLD